MNRNNGGTMRLIIILVLLCMLIGMSGYEEETRSYMDMLSGQIEQLNVDIDTLNKKIDSINNAQIEQQKMITKATTQVDRGMSRGRHAKMMCTAYDLSYQSCQKLPSDPSYGITASTERVKENHTVAADDSIPFGTRLYIPALVSDTNDGIYTVEDRGSAIHGNHIDIYMDNHEDAMNFGTQHLDVYIEE